MTRLRSGLRVSFVNRRNARRHGFRAPAKPNRWQMRKTTRKTKPKANSTGGQSRTRSTKINLAALTRNIHYRQRARAHELATSDSPDILREKRRWVQNEFEASRIDGKVTRELHDLYNKRNIGKPEHQQTKAQSLTDAAKAAKQRLDEVFKQKSGANPPGGAVSVSIGDVSGDVGEMPSIPTLVLDGCYTDNHRALGEPSGDEAVHDPLRDEAAGLAVGEDEESEEETETDDETETNDESSSEGDKHTAVTRTAFNRTADNEAIARQVVLAMGYQLADYSAVNQRTGADVGNMEEGDEVKVKEEDVDE